MSQGVYSLCSPGGGLSCFACCPPIRPPGYDHAQHRGSLTRLLLENTAAIRRGDLPQSEMTGFWCPGLGFLDGRGRQVGCLLHPARNQGRDLRGPTGYRDKCARESCPPARAFADLGSAEQAALIALCVGLDAFAFSSHAQNPVMRLLALGPKVAGAAAGLGLAGIGELKGWSWLSEVEHSQGWLLGRALAAWGAGDLRDPGLAGRLQILSRRVSAGLGPPPPHEAGEPLASLCDEWQARFWRVACGRRRARPGEVIRWRALLERALEA